MPRTILAAASAALVLAAAGAASADVRIAYGDLDLSTAAGAAAFDRRVERAADRACFNARQPGSRRSDRVFCSQQVRAAAFDGLPDRARLDYARARGRLAV